MTGMESINKSICTTGAGVVIKQEPSATGISSISNENSFEEIVFEEIKTDFPEDPLSVNSVHAESGFLNDVDPLLVTRETVLEEKNIVTRNKLNGRILGIARNGLDVSEEDGFTDDESPFERVYIKEETPEPPLLRSGTEPSETQSGLGAVAIDGKKTTHYFKSLPVPCSRCYERFINISSLRVHMRVHTEENRFICHYCNRRFSTISILKRHLRIHTGDRPHRCSECSMCFIQENHLKVHMRVHTGEKPFQCTECNQRFCNKSNLNLHLRIHTGEKPFQCIDCSYRCVKESDLRVHMRMHTGEKPFPCTECNKRFFTKAHLKVHMVIHTGEKPFECRECHKRFARKSDVKRHMLIHTG